MRSAEASPARTPYPGNLPSASLYSQEEETFTALFILEGSTERRNEILTQFMARAKPTPKKEAFLIQSLTLTPTDREILQSLSQEASDNLGWTVSGSAVVRALLRQAAQQGSAWRSTQVLPFIEQEIESGTVWGKKK